MHLVYGVDEETAFKVEAAAIDLIGIDNLTNIHRGHHSGTYGRIDVDELNARFSKRILHREDIDENVLLIRINQLYHYGMSDIELYDATRSSWVINQERAEKLQYVFAVYEGMVMEVYKITAWCFMRLIIVWLVKPRQTVYSGNAFSIAASMAPMVRRHLSG